jgi:transglutaminase-like putative cysteine protease
MAYLRFLLISSFIILSASVLGQDKRKLFRSKEPQTVQELTASLTSGVSGDSAKVMAIYTWITHNVSYDYAVYMSGQPIRFQSPELVFKRKRTTCTGYSNLMVAMLGYAGIPAYTVEGFTQDFALGIDSTKLSSDHAWVAFSVNGNWHVADPTWDAGYIGIIAVVEKTETKMTFKQRLKRFRFRNLVRKKRKSKGNPSKKTITSNIYEEQKLDIMQ